MKNYAKFLKMMVVAGALAGNPIIGPAQLKAQISESEALNAMHKALRDITGEIKKSTHATTQIINKKTPKKDIVNFVAVISESKKTLDEIAKAVKSLPSDPKLNAFKGVITEIHGFIVDWDTAISQRNLDGMVKALLHYLNQRVKTIHAHVHNVENGLKKQLLADHASQVHVELEYLLKELDGLFSINFAECGHPSPQAAFAHLFLSKGFKNKPSNVPPLPKLTKLS